eukprot:Phypoly_transcript_02076.p1 GENE.Phypoly_transcript_02076~~Phypoly_transcript_02076.p1  ORF type:complete len:918 (-),score=109.09 Phypoly_transcript_02076:100-2853(-)
MQYVNGFDISAQGISEIVTINEQVKLPKTDEKDGVSVYEKRSDFHYVAKSQSILNVPAEYAYTQVKNSDYSFLPGCVDHRVIEKYNFDNQVTLIRIRTPTLAGRNLEYCKFVSCYANFVKRMYVVAFQGVKHDQVQYSEGALVIDLLPSGYIIDVPPNLPPEYCRFTLVYQVEMSSFNFDGLGFTRDQVADCVQREHRAIYLSFRQHLESSYHQAPPEPYSDVASHTYHAWLDVMGSLGPAQGWTCQVQKYGLSIYSKRSFSDLIVATRIIWVFDKPPSVIAEAFSLMNILKNYPNEIALTETKVSDTTKIITLEYPSLYVHNKHISQLLVTSQNIGERHITTYCTITELNAPFSLPSGILVMPTEKGGSQMTILFQSCFPSNYLPWPDSEAVKIINGQELAPLKKIRDKLMNNPLQIPNAPLPTEIPFEDQFAEMISNYSNMILQTFDEANETTVHADRFDSHLEKRKWTQLLAKRTPHVEKRKRTEVHTKPVLESISSREISLAPMGKDEGKKPFLFLMSSGQDSRKKFRRITKTTSNTSFDNLSPDILTRVTEYLDINSVLALSATCRFFTCFIHGSAMTWYHQFLKKWHSSPSMNAYTDWRESYLHKVAEERVWKEGVVKMDEWGGGEGHKGRLRKVVWDSAGLVLSCSSDKTVKIWNPETNSLLSSMELPGVISLHTVPTLPRGGILRFLTPHKNGVAQWWEWQNGMITKLRDTRFGYSLKDLIILENNTITWDDEIVKVWDNETGNPISVFSDHQAKITCVVALGKYFIVASADGMISLREIKGNASAEPLVISGHSKSVNCLQVLSLECFASGSSDMYIKIWDLRNAKDSFSTMQHHTGAVRCLYAHDNILVSGGDDSKLNLYFGRKGPYVHGRTLVHSAKIRHLVGQKNSILIGDTTGLLKKFLFEDPD